MYSACGTPEKIAEMGLTGAHSCVLANPTQPDAEGVPWVQLYNPFYSSSAGVGGQTFTILLSPFPTGLFPPNAPWENCTVLAWAPAAQQIASEARWQDVPSYVRHLIKQAAHPVCWSLNAATGVYHQP